MKKSFLIAGVILALAISGCSTAQNSPATTNTNGQTGTTDPTTGKKAGFTTAEVAQHNSAASCYTIIRSKVYDITSFIDKHPGGSEKILGLCGKDGTEAFTNVHGGKEKQETTLNGFEIGPLVN